MKDDCIRSSLIECQSFLGRGININPKYRVLMFPPSQCASIVHDVVYWGSIFCRILMPFVSGISRQEEYCLSLAWILTSRYQSIVYDRMKIKKHIQCCKYVGRIHAELSHCPAMKDQWDYVLNNLEELGDKEFSVLMDQYNIEIFSCCLRPFATCTLPLLIRPMFGLHNIVPKIHTPSISRVQSLHHLLEVDDHDEEEYSVVLILVSDWRIIFWLNISPLFLSNWYSFCKWAGRSTSLWFCFSLWSARKSKYIRFQTQNLRTAS